MVTERVIDGNVAGSCSRQYMADIFDTHGLHLL